ncbi:MAG: GGDEF domain-containing protein [Burkholderiaceae bacterium]
MPSLPPIAPVTADIFKEVFARGPAMQCLTNGTDAVIETSESLLVLLADSRQAVIGKSLGGFMTTASQTLWLAERDRIIERDGVSDYPVQFRSRHGRVIDMLMSIGVQRRDDDGSPTLCVVLTDVSRQIQIQRALEQRARLDEMTGIPNRSWIRERFQIEAARASRHGNPLSLVLFDVDRFKQFNDRHGHAAGDRALVAIATAARRMLRGSDEVGRVGGEEFALVLPMAGLEQALVTAERLRAAIHGLDLADLDLPMACSVSLGVVEVPPGLGTAEAFERADAAMYVAKRLGRNRVVPWSADMTRSTARRASGSSSEPGSSTGSALFEI